MNYPIPRHRVFSLLLVLSVGLVFPLVAKSFSVLYYIVWIFGFGAIIGRYRKVITKRLQAIRLPSLIRFMVIGYGTVLLEEALVGLVHNLDEGISLLGMLTRIGQFWAFNLFAFTGFFLGWYWAARRFRYSANEVFLLSGIWGLWSENIFPLFMTFPVGALVLILPTMATYALIITPALLSLDTTAAREAPPWRRWLTVPILVLLCSLLPVLALTFLRNTFPFVFPPCDYIPCL